MAETETITLPDVGDFDEIEIIEILVNPGETIDQEQALIVLESDKATMEIPSPYPGKIKTLAVVVGDRVSQGSPLATIEVSQPASAEPVAMPESATNLDAESKISDEGTSQTGMPEITQVPEPAPDREEQTAKVLGKTLRPHPGNSDRSGDPAASTTIHASPSIRRYARELGVDLTRVIGSGNKGRIVKADVKAFIKSNLANSGTAPVPGVAVGGLPDIDYSKFGEVDKVALSRIKKISGAHLHRSWITVPHVTQFDEADVTDLEAFRKSLSKEAEQRSVRLTPLVFLMKAAVSALREFPGFNASLDASGENLVMKKYFHIGVAVDTSNGLVVPVVRDVDQKGIFDLAAELGETAQRARDGKLSPADMQGGCFTISSLGGIGGTQFTPIVNAPEVAILGVARSKMQPVYQDGEFVPRLILPLALSYDHRVIDGAEGARFTHYLSQTISDIRRVLL